MTHPTPAPRSEPTPESIARSVAKLRAEGFTVALTGQGKLAVQPADRLPDASDEWLRRNTQAVKALLRAECATPEPTARSGMPDDPGDGDLGLRCLRARPPPP